MILFYGGADECYIMIDEPNRIDHVLLTVESRSNCMKKVCSYREQYVWWLVTDFVAVAMYIVHFNLVYLTKKSIYLFMAVAGLVNWIRLSRINEENT